MKDGDFAVARWWRVCGRAAECNSAIQQITNLHYNDGHAEDYREICETRGRQDFLARTRNRR
jgi:hypothetical protein